ncbi:bifunctional diaminohydroxyphosphoribosylaminopyrimidine deaminase/5-amino-6-(5-phosphoribosylamino)uracil reductase RibD [Asticcacaulis sp. ZE23SCel15]|uniref:bifunctional diaminohydroxyphosphoribosylaminopyrimidine deaminase/5-amino-6-(5-phosphoribosylamino)uracil reductase RibD n=1 Tax=Asticcacaulis sp. ZE23SCel15 TaxID=3059027 RepID=UPI00265F2F96|nr:bifunctional diaminohydroxyphosphoribosylaminopyrimidine deaminase/5-amino-6-(5-phosphoribosylamino)uracil reductase RibD [Asticcacaulis sp. ZE23SCel15]WKL56502.1 bifunctional diaminohydroxyphosphoribosylaminopyrimidine deaminase/5-amino-6-(5-phosphoribosylamino)uracil reductase RibD [Asticcacaulis sp. ZE23SCel15]
MERPFITLKLATTLDGRIATASGQSRWITGEDARRCVHELRAGHDAVLVGIETVIKDDPELTVRLQGYEGFQPTRIVFDSKGRIPLNSKLVQTARVIPTWVVTTHDLNPEIQAAGVKAIKVASFHQRVDILLAMEALTAAGIERLFIEGGGLIATAFIKAGLVDRLEWFRSATILGGDARSVIGFLNIDDINGMIRFNRLGVQAVGDDLWESYELS